MTELGPRRRRGTTWALVGLLVVMINVPLVHGAYLDWRFDRSGVDSVAEVVETEESEGEPKRYVIEFRLEESLDPAQEPRTSAVTGEAYELAERDGEIDVRVLQGDPLRFRVAGEPESSAALWLALVGNAIVVLIWLLRRWYQRRHQPLELYAIADVERCPRGGSVEPVPDEPGTYDVVGEVVELEPGRMVIQAGEAMVRIDLDGHHNPVGYEQPARVRARMRH